MRFPWFEYAFSWYVFHCRDCSVLDKSLDIIHYGGYREDIANGTATAKLQHATNSKVP